MIAAYVVKILIEHTYCVGSNIHLEDHQSTLASYGVTDGSTLALIIRERNYLYVIGLDGAMHEVEVPSTDPEVRLFMKY